MKPRDKLTVTKGAVETLGTASQIAPLTQSCVLNIVSVLRERHCASTLA